MKRSLILSLSLVGGCFGEGPVPTAPSAAQTVYFVTRPTQNQCSESRYIADVALGDGHGYAMILPYTPFNGNCGDSNGGQSPQIDVPVASFGTTTPGAMTISTAGRSGNGGQAHLAAYGDDAAWAYIANTTMSTSLKVTGTGDLDVSIQSNMTTYNPVAMTADATAFYVGGIQNSGSNGRNSDVNEPGYPCCGPLGTPGDVAGQIYSVTRAGVATALPLNPKLNCQTTKTCLVNNSTSLVYAEYETPITTSSATLITSAPKTGGAAVNLGKVARPSGVVVGLGANDQMVVWSSSVAYEYQPYPAPFCHVRGYDLTSNTEVMLLDSSAFSCMDAAVDATHVYFAIVEVNEDDGGGGRMRGIGIGRVTLDGKTFESIRLGVDGDAAGARRVYVQGDDIYAVDPFVVAKIAKASFDGAHDFSLLL